MSGDATAAEILAEFVTKEDLERKQLYPAFPNIRNISAKIAAGVAAAAYDLGKQIITFALQDYTKTSHTKCRVCTWVLWVLYTFTHCLYLQWRNNVAQFIGS